MNNEMKKDALTEEELAKVSGGTGSPFDPGKIDPSALVVDRTIPDYCTPVEVHDGTNRSAICPYHGIALANENYTPIFADWLFRCDKCNKWFIKRDGKWYVSDRKPM